MDQGKFLLAGHGSRLRLQAYFRVGVAEGTGTTSLDYSGALKATLQQQRVRGLFEGLRRARVPFLYQVMMTEAAEEAEGNPLLQFDLVVGTWADGKEKEMDKLAATLEQRASVLSATIGVAMPEATVVRLERGDLSGYVKSLLLPGRPELPQSAPPALGGTLCSFEGMSPGARHVERSPEFHLPSFEDYAMGRIVLGSAKSAGGEYHDFSLSMEDMKRHVAVLGMTGSGKSTTAMTIVSQVARSGLPLMVLDWHNEYRNVIANAGGTVLSPGSDPFSLNPVEVGQGTDQVEHVAMVTDIFADIYHFTHPQAYMFKNALQKKLAESKPGEPPTLAALVKTIKGYPLRSAYDNETKVALLRRLAPLTEGQAGKALGGTGSHSLPELLKIPVCIELGQFRDIQTRAVFCDIVLKMLYEERVKKKAELEHLTVVEEARNIAPMKRPEDPQSVGERMISELRKFGESMMFVAQFPTHVTPDIVKNSGTKIVHRMDWPEDVALMAESMALNRDQRQHLTKLEVGEAVVSVSRISEPMLVQVRPRPSGQGDSRALSSRALS